MTLINARRIARARSCVIDKIIAHNLLFKLNYKDFSLSKFTLRNKISSPQ